MTRFARAKGSKSSNEKKPEEATSWSEMKNAMLSKKESKTEEKQVSENVKEKNDDAPKETEWASLEGDAHSEYVEMIKKHFQKINRPEETKKVKKKKSKHSETELLSDEKSKSGKKAKKSKIILDEAEPEVKKKKKKKKRELTETEDDIQVIFPKKKKKLLKIGEVSASEENEIDTDEEIKIIKVVKNDGNKKFVKNKSMKLKHKKSDKREDDFNPKMQEKQKGEKRFKNKYFQEGNSQIEELMINGEKIPITKFQGFYVTLDDAERLKKLKTDMVKKGISNPKMESAIKLERRRAEKALSRLKKSVCFQCRGHGHLLSSCPELLEKENTGTGICYKCGSTEHSAAECKVVKGTDYQFAECFICKEQGHIASQCPDNPRGLYPHGGACKECGDVTHLRKDCPKRLSQKAEEVVTVGLRSDRDLECLDEEIADREKQKLKKKVKKNSTVKF